MTLYAIGDIQGCAAAFEALLDKISFAPGRDHLWLAGDLVNRGPQSLEALRRVKALGESVTCVLGNHDLHLLAMAAGIRKVAAGDTVQEVLDAPDAPQLIDWLRRRPLLHHDPGRNRLLVHAGLPPDWHADHAARSAAKVERALRTDDWQKSLRTMYGNSPSRWSSGLSDADRRRYTINALTRMRFCRRASGELDFEHSEAPGDQPPDLIPWFDVPHRRAAGVHIVFGHWSALGLYRRENITALDTGCVWGRSLTAVPLEPAGRPVTVACG